MSVTLVKSRDATMQSCIDDCADCHVMCMEMLFRALDRGRENADPVLLRCLGECLDATATLQDFCLLNSRDAGAMARVCQEACLDAAESCEKAFGDDRSRKCAEICRRCAASSGEIAKLFDQDRNPRTESFIRPAAL